MITKQRLKELIEQGATVYYIQDNKYIKEIQCENIPSFWRREEWLNIHTDTLFETKEDANEFLEFGNVTWLFNKIF